MSDARPGRRGYLAAVVVLLGSLGVGSLLFWLVVRPLQEGEGTPLRILFAFVVLVAVVGAGFVVSFLLALVTAIRRHRSPRG